MSGSTVRAFVTIASGVTAALALSLAGASEALADTPGADDSGDTGINIGGPPLGAPILPPVRATLLPAPSIGIGIPGLLGPSVSTPDMITPVSPPTPNMVMPVSPPTPDMVTPTLSPGS